MSEVRLANPYTDELEDVMSNFDHTIEQEIAEQLKTTEAFARYAGWNFNGRVWWDRDKKTYHCEVWVYGTPQKIFSGTLEEIMADVSDEYGSE